MTGIKLELTLLLTLLVSQADCLFSANTMTGRELELILPLAHVLSSVDFAFRKRSSIWLAVIAS